MQIDLTDEDIKYLAAALNAIQVAGVENMRKVVTLIDKLKPTKSEDTP